MAEAADKHYSPDRDISWPTTDAHGHIDPIGTLVPTQITSPTDLGSHIRAARKAQGLRQEDVALAAGVGIRFVSELERGKPGARLAETLRVLAAVGIRLEADGPQDP